MAQTQRQAADGFNNAAGLANITANYQGYAPRGIQYPRYITLADGTVVGRGVPFEVVEYSEKLTAAEYAAILTVLGMTAAYTSISNEITYRTIGADRSTYANYNAIVVHKAGEGDALWEKDRYTFVRFTFKLVEAL